MAKPGYGKRTAPGRQSRRAADFGSLPPREAYIASIVDGLPDGAAMDAKTLAKHTPHYGQQAVRSALTNLSVAGHLRRVRGLVGEDGQTRWVFRTFWSRTARDNAWWTAYLNSDTAAEAATAVGAVADVALPVSPPAWVPEAPPERQEPRTAAAASHASQTKAYEPKPQPEPSAHPDPQLLTPAYAALAQLGLSEPRLALSAADCAALEEHAAQWLARGASAEHVVRTLTAGLPEQVHAPRAFVRRRLLDKMPPLLPECPTVTPRTIMECTECGIPGRPEVLPDGLCRACRTPDTGSAPLDRRPRDSRGDGAGSGEAPYALAVERDVRSLIAQVRAGLKMPLRA